VRFWSRPSSREAHQNIQKTIPIVIADTTTTIIPTAVISDILPVGTVRTHSDAAPGDEHAECHGCTHERCERRTCPRCLSEYPAWSVLPPSRPYKCRDPQTRRSTGLNENNLSHLGTDVNRCHAGGGGCISRRIDHHGAFSPLDLADSAQPTFDLVALRAPAPASGVMTVRANPDDPASATRTRPPSKRIGTRQRRPARASSIPSRTAWRVPHRSSSTTVRRREVK
jgi:hypothetical protein